MENKRSHNALILVMIINFLISVKICLGLYTKVSMTADGFIPFPTLPQILWGLLDCYASKPKDKNHLRPLQV